VKTSWMGQPVIVAFPAWTVIRDAIRPIAYLWQRHGDVRSEQIEM
jgi:hypothetical protein